MINQPCMEMWPSEDIISSAASKQQLCSAITRPNIKSIRLRRTPKCQRTAAGHPFPTRGTMMATTPFSTAQARWSAIVARNPDAVGTFVYAVQTTGIYCRPDCKARLARQANVVFYNSGPFAEEAGYRACKRCKPQLLASPEEDPLFGKIQHAVHLVEDNASRGHKISLGELSGQVGLSKWHLQRVFTKLNGMSPNQLSTSILNTIQAEESQQAAMSETDSNVPTPGQHSVDVNSETEVSSADMEGLDAVQVDWAESETTEVDAVLKELFPELYTDALAWPEF